MNQAEFSQLLCTQNASKVLKTLSTMPASNRRVHAKTAAKLLKDTQMTWDAGPEVPKVMDDDSVRIGVLATATLSELKKVTFHAIPLNIGIDVVLRALSPDWIGDWVEALVEDNPYFVHRLAPVWKHGLCRRPTSDAFILGYYAHRTWWDENDYEPEFLKDDVWRFFEVEGGGEFSLASHDKYCSVDYAWATKLRQLAENGTLDRNRLLDASLDALEKDFGQFRAGWYARFHTALDPTPQDCAKRGKRYVLLLNSTIPPTVSFALKIVAKLEKSGDLVPDILLQHIEPVLLARQKSTVMLALKLISAVAKKDPTFKGRAARLAMTALVHESGDVQAKALDIVEASEMDDALRSNLADYQDLVTPSVQSRLMGITGASSELPASTPAPSATVKSEDVPQVSNQEEALALFLSVLEEPRDPIAVERSIDGIAKFGAELRRDATALQPLEKRAKQVMKLAQEVKVRSVLAITGYALATGQTVAALFGDGSGDSETGAFYLDDFPRVFLLRNAEVIDGVLAGQSVPMLSLPSDTSGSIAPADLVARLALLRRAGQTPGATDLALALLRLGADGRGDAMQGFDPQSDSDNAVAYALGADVVPGHDKALWAAAWAARQPTNADDRIASLFDVPTPDCGVPAVAELVVARREGDGFAWLIATVPSTPAETVTAGHSIPAMFYPKAPNKYFQEAPCGRTFADIAWASLIRPNWPEPFFRQAVIHMDTYQKLTDHHCRAYLEPFLRPGGMIGPLGLSTLAYFLASEDKSVSALTVETVSQLYAEGRLEAEAFGHAVKPFLMSGALPTARWTKTFAAIAWLEARNVPFIQDAIAVLLDFEPQATPRDMGGMLELLFELHTASRTVPKREELRDCLRRVPGGGKIAKFSKLLLQLGT